LICRSQRELGALLAAALGEFVCANPRPVKIVSDRRRPRRKLVMGASTIRFHDDFR
jgi:hypothetical protein